MCPGTYRPPSGTSSATCVESTFQRFNALSTVRRSTISTMRRQATSTSSCSTAKCDVFSTYTLRSRRGLDVPDVTTVGGCPSRRATLNEVVVDSSVATAELSPPTTYQVVNALSESGQFASLSVFCNVSILPHGCLVGLRGLFTGVGTEPPAGSRGIAPCQGVRGRSHP